MRYFLAGIIVLGFIIVLLVVVPIIVIEVGKWVEANRLADYWGWLLIILAMLLIIPTVGYVYNRRK